MTIRFLRRCIALGATVAFAAAAPAQAAQQYVNILTGGTSGVYYPLGVTLSQVVSKALPDAKATVQATKASAS
jgi:TRAP-type uncharacterized transport system substrate-binding protein